MPTFDIIKEHQPEDSFRVQSICSKFDLQTSMVKERFKGEISLEDSWQIGLITGHSGTGKTTIASQLFPEAYMQKFHYTEDSILNDMPEEKTIDAITKTFNSVGFSSPPSWLKPYSVLSEGEKMRVNLARSILSDEKLIVFDEFTSTVDRQVAQTGSMALAKAIRRTEKQFIAVTCHEDVLEWLQPDWVFNTNRMEYEYIRGHLQRPEIQFSIHQKRGFWQMFRKYHYLNHDIASATQQWVGVYNGRPVAFIGIMHHPHNRVKNFKRCSRLVVLPDYQGIGIGGRFLSWVANYYTNKGFRFIIITSTPALLYSFKKSKTWRCYRYGRVPPHGQGKRGLSHWHKSDASHRITSSWEYVPSNQHK